jgi:hypothetical protein
MGNELSSVCGHLDDSEPIVKPALTEKGSVLFFGIIEQESEIHKNQI